MDKKITLIIEDNMDDLLECVVELLESSGYEITAGFEDQINDVPQDNIQEFLIVYESLWNNKFTMKSKIGQLGTDINKLLSGNIYGEYKCEFDLNKFNSDNPYDVGTFGLGFYDIEISDNIDEECEEYGGRIMIFTI